MTNQIVVIDPKILITISEGVLANILTEKESQVLSESYQFLRLCGWLWLAPARLSSSSSSGIPNREFNKWLAHYNNLPRWFSSLFPHLLVKFR